jgi:hypothetical protein
MPVPAIRCHWNPSRFRDVSFGSFLRRASLDRAAPLSQRRETKSDNGFVLSMKPAIRTGVNQSPRVGNRSACTDQAGGVAQAADQLSIVNCPTGTPKSGKSGSPAARSSRRRRSGREASSTDGVKLAVARWAPE